MPYLQADLGDVKQIEAVATSGHANVSFNRWVTSYVISYSHVDGNFTTIKMGNGTERVFDGNNDSTSVKLNDFNATLARYVRLVPRNWQSQQIATRWEIYGCDYYG